MSMARGVRTPKFSPVVIILQVGDFGLAINTNRCWQGGRLGAQARLRWPVGQHIPPVVGCLSCCCCLATSLIGSAERAPRLGFAGRSLCLESAHWTTCLQRWAPCNWAQAPACLCFQSIKTRCASANANAGYSSLLQGQPARRCLNWPSTVPCLATG